MTRHCPHAVLLLFLLLIFATPVVGQEAGQRARGEVVPGILGSVDPMSMVEGFITPDLLQLEMEDGTIIARDMLINPEYFGSLRPNFFETVLVGAVGGVVLKFILGEIFSPAIGVATCALIGTVSPGEKGCLEDPGLGDPLPSYPVTFGVGAGVLASLWVLPVWKFDWRPW